MNSQSLCPPPLPYILQSRKHYPMRKYRHIFQFPSPTLFEILYTPSTPENIQLVPHPHTPTPTPTPPLTTPFPPTSHNHESSTKHLTQTPSPTVPPHSSNQF